MGISFDPDKRDATLAERGLDFADAVFVFAGVTVEMEDNRKNRAYPVSSQRFRASVFSARKWGASTIGWQ